MLPGHPFRWEEWAELKLEPRHDPVASFRWYPVPSAECDCVCAHGTDLPRHLQVGRGPPVLQLNHVTSVCQNVFAVVSPQRRQYGQTRSVHLAEHPGV